MGIYRDNLSAIIYHRLSLSLKRVLTYRLPISLLQYVRLSPINYLDKRFFVHKVFKVRELALWKKYTVSINSHYNVKNLSLFYCQDRVRDLLSFLEKLKKHFCNLTSKKPESNALKIYRNIYRQ